MAGIISVVADVPVNESGFENDVPKLSSQPPGWNEVDGYEEHWREDDMVATRIFVGPWGTRKKFIDYLLGRTNTFVDPRTAFLSVSRILPAQHPEYPWLFATDARVTGKGAWTNNPNVVVRDRFGHPVLDAGGQQIPNPMIAYYDYSTGTDSSSAFVTVQYSHRDYDLRNDADAWAQPTRELSRYVSRYFKPAIQHLGISNLTANLFFQEGPIVGTPIKEGGVKLIPTMQLTMVLHQFPDVPWDAFDACVGRINLNPFDGAPGYRTYGTGTLLCQAPEVKRIKSIVGRVTWEITYRFDYRGSIKTADDQAATWNHFPADNGNLYRAAFYPSNTFNVGVPVAVYKSADFSQLFQPPAPVNYQ